MTTQPTPAYQMNLKAGEAIMLDIERTLRQIQTVQKKQQNSYTSWQELAAAHAAPDPMLTADNDAAPLVGVLLTGLLDMLFGGMPVMQTLAHGVEGAVAVAHAEEKPTPHAFEALAGPARINAMLKASQAASYNRAMAGHNTQARQMQMLQQMTMMLMLNMLTQNDDTKSSGGDDMMAPDILRDPKMARFKQNRHSISCIRTMFLHHAEITTPVYKAAPRCTLG